jgi:hypothetical protein
MSSGDLKFLPGDSEGEVDASNFKVVVAPEHALHTVLTPATVCAVGPIEHAVGRDWVISVATYDRQVGAIIYPSKCS